MTARWKREHESREQARIARVEAMLGEILIRVAKQRRAWLPFIVRAALNGGRTVPA